MQSFMQKENLKKLLEKNHLGIHLYKYDKEKKLVIKKTDRELEDEKAAIYKEKNRAKKRIDSKEILNELTEHRNKTLKDTDYTQLADSPCDATTRRQYKYYRQYLRELPNKYREGILVEKRVLGFKSWVDKYWNDLK